MENHFDKAVLSALIKKAIGSQTQKNFAKSAGFGEAHLSRLLHGKYNTVPNIQTLKRIADQSQTVTYQQLLQAAGYMDIHSSLITTSAKPDAATEKLITATLLTALQSPWTVVKAPEQTGCNLSVKLIDGPFQHWHFHYINHKEPMVMQHQLEVNYLRLIFQEIDSRDKYSFVATSINEYEYYTGQKPLNLALNISIILVDTFCMNIVQETVLQTNGQFTNQDLSYFSF